MHLDRSSSEELPYKSEFADRYIANLTLHIVENPGKMLAETFRILSSGGIAGFSVWGR